MDQIESGHSRHAHVGNNAIKSLPVPRCGEKIPSGCETGCVNILTGKIETQRVEHRFIIVNDRDVKASVHCWTVFAMGSVKWTAPPCPPSSSHNLPPWASTIDRHSGKPMPRPSALLDANGRNAFSGSWAENPGPESTTRTSTKSASKIFASMTTVPRRL